MSGGALDYFYCTLQEHDKDFGDKELNELVSDLAELFHDREWFLSADTGEGDWNEVHLKAKPLWRQGGHGYYGCYEYIIQCDNIECGCRLANLGKNNTIYSTPEEAARNAVEAWNRRVDNG